jgi:hypothetical protein
MINKEELAERYVESYNFEGSAADLLKVVIRKDFIEGYNAAVQHVKDLEEVFKNKYPKIYSDSGNLVFEYIKMNLES